MLTDEMDSRPHHKKLMIKVVSYFYINNRNPNVRDNQHAL